MAHRRAVRWWPILPFCLVASVAAMSIAHGAFPSGSANLDEVAYQAQARALSEGQLTLDSELHSPSFLPYLSAVRDDDVVFKYQPLWPAILALAGTPESGGLLLPSTLAAGAVISIAWFTWELTRSRRASLIAAGIVALTPFVWIQAATLLGYHPSLVLLTAGGGLLLCAARHPRPALVVLSGLVGALGLMHRPADAVIVLGPIGVLALLRVEPSLRVRHAALLGVGAIPVVVALLAYNQATTGSAARFPFDLAGGIDDFGFGRRASFVVAGADTAGQVHYTPRLAFESSLTSLEWFVAFVPAGPLFMVAAGLGIWVHRASSSARTMVVIVGLVLCVYFAWWGTANLIDFGLHKSLGPFYHYMLLAVLIPAAGWGIESTVERWGVRSWAGLAVIGLLWLPVNLTTFREAERTGTLRAEEVAQYSVGATSLVLVPPAFPGDPYVRYVNDPNLDGVRLVGIDDPARRIGIATQFGLPTYLIRDFRAIGDLFGEGRRDRVPLELVQGHRLVVDVERRSSPDVPDDAMLYLRVGDQIVAVSALDTATWTLTGPVDAGEIAVGAGVRDGRSDQVGSSWECRFPVVQAGEEIVAAAPCDGWTHYVFPDGAEADSREDLSSLLTVRIRPEPPPEDAEAG